MRIAIDASRATRLHSTGTEAYSRELLKALVPIAGHHRLTLYYDRAPFERIDADHVTTRVITAPRLWTHGRLSAEMMLRAPDLLFIPAHVIPLIHPRRTVVTIHDLGYLRYRLASRPARWIHLLLSTLWSARVAKRVIVDSAATARDLARHTAIDPAVIDIVPLGVSARFARRLPDQIAAMRHELGLPESYLLFVGTQQPRKNLPRLLRAYALAREQSPMPPLVLVGLSSNGSMAIDRTIDRLHLNDVVIRAGFVADRLMPDLYSGAYAFLFPTLYEGFGLPVLEAMACGTPVLTATNSSLPEVAGDAAILVNAVDEHAIASAIARLVREPRLREELGRRGVQQASLFSWQRTASLTLAALERAAY